MISHHFRENKILFLKVKLRRLVPYLPQNISLLHSTHDQPATTCLTAVIWLPDDLQWEEKSYLVLSPELSTVVGGLFGCTDLGRACSKWSSWGYLTPHFITHCCCSWKNGAVLLDKITSMFLVSPFHRWIHFIALISLPCTSHTLPTVSGFRCQQAIGSESYHMIPF